MAVGDAHVFPGFLQPVLTQLSFQSHRLFSHILSRGERRKYAEKKVHLKRESNSQPPGHESDTLTTDPSSRGQMVVTTRDCVENGYRRCNAPTVFTNISIRQNIVTLVISTACKSTSRHSKSAG